jgi:hypothetical protein
VAIRPRGRWGRPPKPANEGITDSGDGALDSKPANEGITDSAHRERNAIKDSSRSMGAPFREFICERMQLGRNSMAIYQDLVDAHGFSGRYVTVRRFVTRLFVFTLG